MKKIILYTGVLALFAASTGCKKYLDINQNPNSPTSVQEKLLLAPIEVNVANAIAAGGEATAATFTNHFMQMVCYNQVALNFGTYYFVNTNFNASWSAAYTTCLGNLDILRKQSVAKGNSNYTAISEVLEAYVLGFATDIWGDVPWSQALQGIAVQFPVYDKQAAIYDTVQSLLDKAIVDIDKKAGLKVGADDYYYAGDMTKWRKLAYTLKARYYMHLTKAPGKTAAGQAQLALTALQNGMTGVADEWKFTYPGTATSQNIWYVNMQPLSTLVASQAIVDTLKTRNDPRLPFLITKAKNTGLYNGRPIGAPTIGKLDDYSLLGSFYCSVNSAVFIMPYTEVQFIQAEANLITTGVAAAQPFYTAGITTHMNKLGVASGDQTTYLAARGTLGASTALEQIMQEKKIADFLSVENFNDWRRTGFPKLTIVPNAQAPAIPRRMPYPQNEINANPQPQQSATLVDRVWWDVQ
ncbi:MAG: SusD/RagB family nutrient-binding outer membrane lipoprotein [Bacteroidetes bacterium]|nr:SusD/RagB family nutrient-binding outer membrane lipoprotein [Bacteroidota bacterium]